MMGTRRAGVLAVCVAMALTGCVTKTGGAPVSQTRSGVAASQTGSTSPDHSAVNLLGDFTTVDPCSLTDPREFAAFGVAKWGVLDGLDDCLVEVTISARQPVRVYVGALDRAGQFPDLTSKKRTELPGGLKVYDTVSEPTRCARLLVFTDNITLSVNAAQDNRAEPKLCELVKAGMDKAVAVIRDGAVKHRTFPPNSLGSIDPCSLVSPEVRAKVPGLSGVGPEGWPAKHSCTWARTAGNDHTRLRVNFMVDTPIKAGARGSREQSIAGRSTLIYETPGEGDYVFCSAQTNHISFPAPNQEGLVEAANLFVRLPGARMAEACQFAAEVAAVLWPKLPTP